MKDGTAPSVDLESRLMQVVAKLTAHPARFMWYLPESSKLERFTNGARASPQT